MRHLKVIIPIVVIVLLVAGGAFWYFFGQQSQPSGTTAGSAIVDTLANKTVTAADLQGKKADDLFFEYFKNAAMQQKLIVIKEYTITRGNNPPTDTSYFKTGFDYGTKKLVYANDFVLSGSNGRSKARCIDGQYYYKSIYASSFQRDAKEDALNCTLLDVGSNINDGINTGGLTADQANTFVSKLRTGINGYMQVKGMDVVQHGGKSYIHFKVEMRPVYASNLKEYVGAQWLMTAFKATGLSPIGWPYSYSGAMADGFDYDYYVDPSLKLPVYSTLATTGQLDQDGKSVTVDAFDHYKTEYQFGVSEFDNAITNDQNITLSW